MNILNYEGGKREGGGKKLICSKISTQKHIYIYIHGFHNKSLDITLSRIKLHSEIVSGIPNK